MTKCDQRPKGEYELWCYAHDRSPSECYEAEIKDLKQQIAFLEVKERARAKLGSPSCGTCRKRVDREDAYKCFHCKFYVCAECAAPHFGKSH